MCCVRGNGLSATRARTSRSSCCRIYIFFSFITLRRIDCSRLNYLISTSMRYELEQCKLKGVLHDTTYETKRREDSVSLQHTYGRIITLLLWTYPPGVHNKVTAVHLKNKIMSRAYVTEIVDHLTRYLIYIILYTPHTHHTLYCTGTTCKLYEARSGRFRLRRDSKMNL